MAAEVQPIPDNTSLFRQLDAYPWDQDEEFQGGLQAILGSVQDDPQQVQHLTLRAKCYYYARKAGQPVDFNGYKEWIEEGRQGNGRAQSQEQVNGTLNNNIATEDATAGMDDPPKPASFAELCELIAEGKEIPGIKDIPDTILEGQKSDSQAQRRKKPWEKESGGEKPSWMT